MPDTRRLLELALKGLEAERASIDDEIAEIKRQISNTPKAGQDAGGAGSAAGATAGQPARRRKYKMSAEARRKISEAMKRRYANLKKGTLKK